MRAYPTARPQQPRPAAATLAETMRVTPHLVAPDAAEAAGWYARAFGAEERSRVPLPGDKVMTVKLRIGDSAVHVASEVPEAGILSPGSIGGTATVLQINTDDADALWQRAIDAGATVQHPFADQFWGERHGQLTDPYGHRWNIAQRVREVPPDELAAAAARAFGG
jgi:PhnB protein